MTFAERLKTIMRERGTGPVAVARKVPCDPGYVSRVANGHQDPSAHLGRRLDQILGAGGELAALAVAGHDTPDGPGGAADIRESSQALVRLEGRLGGDDVLAAAVRAFRAARDAVKAAGGAAGRDLLAAAAEAGEVAAWIAYDSADFPLSHRLAAAALPLAREAGDTSMEHFLQCHAAMLDIDMRRPVPALAAADQVLAAGKLAPSTRAAFQIRRGRALAQLGDKPRADEALADAARIIENGPGSRDPWWTFWIDPAEINWHLGKAAADAGDPAAAVPGLARAMELRAAPRIRTRFNDGAHLLDALVRAGAWSEAVPLAWEVARMGRGITSARTRVVLRDTARRMAADGPQDAEEAVRLLSR